MSNGPVVPPDPCCMWWWTGHAFDGTRTQKCGGCTQCGRQPAPPDTTVACWVPGSCQTAGRGRFCDKERLRLYIRHAGENGRARLYAHKFTKTGR
jgi:hypothetical protein